MALEGQVEGAEEGDGDAAEDDRAPHARAVLRVAGGDTRRRSTAACPPLSPTQATSRLRLELFPIKPPMEGLETTAGRHTHNINAVCPPVFPFETAFMHFRAGLVASLTGPGGQR